MPKGRQAYAVDEAACPHDLPQDQVRRGKLVLRQRRLNTRQHLEQSGPSNLTGMRLLPDRFG